MSRISGGNTKPEIIVRKLLHAQGYRFRLHVRNLPGKPDIVLPRYRKVIFVHGCFWHGHMGCRRAERPATNEEFWNAKIDSNIRRDASAQQLLSALGWEVLVVWSCETGKPEELTNKLIQFISSKTYVSDEGKLGRRSQVDNPEELRQKLLKLLTNFESNLNLDDLRQRVRGLVPVFNALRDLGSSMIPEKDSGRDRILLYLRKFPYTPINGQELMVVAGIDDWARRVRELRVEHGWKILSGVTAADILQEWQDEEGAPPIDIDLREMQSDDYILLDPNQDREAAHRWKSANRIRRLNLSIKNKILMFFKENVGNEISGEELRYVANNKTEWARRVRELRTEDGWPVLTKTTGMPELPVGIYVFASARQSPKEDRAVKDALRRQVFVRDQYRCRDCSWHPKQWNRSDPRNLEAHHEIPHSKGGKTTKENLTTLCNVCHDVRHRNGRD